MTQQNSYISEISGLVYFSEKICAREEQELKNESWRAKCRFYVGEVEIFPKTSRELIQAYDNLTEIIVTDETVLYPFWYWLGFFQEIAEPGVWNFSENSSGEKIWKKSSKVPKE